MNKKIVILIVLWSLTVFLFYYFYSTKPIQDPVETIEKIDSLDSRIDSIYIIKDSICERVDTIYIELDNNNKQYEENVINIINNNASEDYRFFLEYINSNRIRFDSINNNF